ncbi:hypothetical protein [Sphingomonas lycopersici]|uniref:Uncharacterized protein n=1 Tax=Sphingomonas lycopersici TaxID=2951807 RepID=A0AA42CTZ7_9SPHN|nr:hypothetical protein [Sphingomonas lycopersici]MCW6534903.1 hypothetical protein [Sphingomonas lycopersici]
MTRWAEIAARAGARRAVRVAERLAARVTRDGARVTIAGRGVLAALRWPAGLLR